MKRVGVLKFSFYKGLEHRRTHQEGRISAHQVNQVSPHPHVLNHVIFHVTVYNDSFSKLQTDKDPLDNMPDHSPILLHGNELVASIQPFFSLKFLNLSVHSSLKIWKLPVSSSLQPIHSKRHKITNQPLNSLNSTNNIEQNNQNPKANPWLST